MKAEVEYCEYTARAIRNERRQKLQKKQAELRKKGKVVRLEQGNLLQMQMRDHEKQVRQRALPEIAYHATCPTCLRLQGQDVQCTQTSVLEPVIGKNGSITLKERELTTCFNDDSGEATHILN